MVFIGGFALAVALYLLALPVILAATFAAAWVISKMPERRQAVFVR